MPVIRDRDGNVIQRSRNMRGVREYVASCQAVKIDVSRIGRVDTPANGDKGKLCILFVNGSSFETNFASFNVLKGWVSRWRNVQGTPLTVNGEDAGTVSLKNPKLQVGE